MCSVLFLQGKGPEGQLVFNRDEQLGRPHSEPPAIYEVDGIRMIYSRDPQGGGTWCAMNDRLRIAGLLNNYCASGAGLPRAKSRGLLIPGVLGKNSVGDGIRWLESRVDEQFGPFHLFVLEIVGVKGEGFQIDWDGVRLSTQPLPTGNWFLSSSSLKPQEIVAKRSGWMKGLIQDGLQAEGAVEAMSGVPKGFSPEEACCMDRTQTRTVSQVCIRLADSHGTFAFRERNRAGGFSGFCKVELNSSQLD